MSRSFAAEPHEPMDRVSPARPCPACGRGNWCLITADGRRGICPREESPHRAGEAGWLHIYEGEPDGPRPDRPQPRRRVTAVPPPDLGDKAAEWGRLLKPAGRRACAAQLGLPADVLDDLPLVGSCGGRMGEPPHLSFPETDPSTGSVVGLARREPDLAAGVVRRSHTGVRGLYLFPGWADRPGPVLLVEGATDVLACRAAGLCVVGRPSNTGGGRFLAALLRDWPAARGALVVGENDRNEESGEWPGRKGAEDLFKGLTEAGIPARLTMPPANYKDVRVWLTAAERGDTSWADRGRELLALLTAAYEGVAKPVAGLPSKPRTARARENLPRVNEGPSDPHRLARTFLAADDAGGPPKMWRWRDEWPRWRDGCYRTLPLEELTAELTTHVKAAFDRAHWAEMAARPENAEGRAPVVLPVTPHVLRAALNALTSLRCRPADAPQPGWADGRPGPDPRGVAAFPNGLLDLSAYAAGAADAFGPPDPAFFTPTVLGFAFDSEAGAPARWLRFLRELWPDDPASVACLQEWFAYLLSPRTDLQRILMLVGPGGAGKGTILRVLTRLLGERNVATPTLHQLGTEFGPAVLLGRTAALVTDASLGRRSDVAEVVSVLKRVSGEDEVEVNRKHQPMLKVRLPVRFVIAANRTLDLPEASSAVTGRLVVLRLTRKFRNTAREDTGLEGRLAAELPGVFRWALDGWARLHERGGFVQPASGRSTLAQLADQGRPVGSFVSDRCVTGPEWRVPKAELFAAYRAWCLAGNQPPGTDARFAADLTALDLAIDTSKPRVDGRQVPHFTGIRLSQPWDADLPDSSGAPSARLEPGEPGEPGQVTQTKPTLVDTALKVESSEPGEPAQNALQLKVEGEAEEAIGGHVEGTVRFEPAHPAQTTQRLRPLFEELNIDLPTIVDGSGDDIPP